MTVLPAPRRVVDGQPRNPTARYSRSGRSGKVVSVSKRGYDRITALATEHGCSKADVVRAAIALVLDSATPPEVLAVIVERARGG